MSNSQFTVIISRFNEFFRKLLNPKFLLGFVLCIVFIAAFSFFLPPSYDWTNVYRPAALALISRQSPYAVERFINPPWTLLPFLPLLIFPEAVGRAIIALITIVALSYIVHRLGGKPISMLFFLLSPPVIQMIQDGNVDWLAALGFIMPPQIGLFFVVIKPQIGIAVAIFWLIEIWRKFGFKGVIRVFAPAAVLTILSLVVFGLWPLKVDNAFGWGGNASLWPISIPVGLGLLVGSIQKQKIDYAIAASPCLSPYVLLHSWIGPLLAIIRNIPVTIVVVIGMWILVAIRWAEM